MKRRKTEFEDLRDETLMEILVRVPVKSGHQCKLVSKRWLALISSPYFVGCHRRQHQDNYHLHRASDPYTKINNYIPVQKIPKSHPVISLLNQQWPSSWIFCVSNDLLLTASNCGGAPNLSVSKTLTKQSYRLPEPPPCFLDKRPIIADFRGIICSVDDPAHYKVVLVKDSPHLVRRGGSIVRSSEVFKFYVFSSDISSWCNFLVPAPPNFLTETMFSEAIGQYTTTLDGALYWCTNMIMVYNPFDKVNSQHCDFIHLPQEAKVSKDDLRSLCIANVEQHLRLYHWSFVTAFTQTLTVWDLKDDCTWSIKQFVDLTSINWLCKDVKMSIKGFDPYDGDVLLLSKVFSKDDCLLSVNLRSKTVKLVSDFKSTASSIWSSIILFPFCPPLWPTPITKSMAATATPAQL